MSARTRSLLLCAPALLAAFVGAFFAVREVDSDAAFVLSQQRPNVVEADVLERVVRAAPEPVPGDDGRPGVAASCRPGRQDGFLRNPWVCRVRYPTKHVISYTIRIRPDGSFRGLSPGRTRAVFGQVSVGSG